MNSNPAKSDNLDTPWSKHDIVWVNTYYLSPNDKFHLFSFFPSLKVNEAYRNNNGPIGITTGFEQFLNIWKEC